MRKLSRWKKAGLIIRTAGMLAVVGAVVFNVQTAWAAPSSGAAVSDNIVVREEAVSGAQVGSLYADQEVTITGETQGTDGNVWYQILSGPYAGNYIYSGETELVKYVNDLSITINNQIPTNIVQGTACQPSEIIKSRHNITNVTGAIYSAETYKLIYSGSVSPNVHDSYSTANTAITEVLKFHLLAPGEYIYVVTATATTSLDFQAKGSENGTGITCLESKTFKETLYSKGFTVSAAPHEHTYGDWSKDGTNHWHECTCGDKADVAEHSFRWVIDRTATATQKGSKHEECTVCGYRRAAVEIPATGTTTGGTTGGGSHWHPSVTTTPVPVIVIPPKTGDMTIWQSILHFLGIR